MARHKDNNSPDKPKPTAGSENREAVLKAARLKSALKRNISRRKDAAKKD